MAFGPGILDGKAEMGAMPARIKLALAGTVALLLAGAMMLFWQRGGVMLLDLGTAAGRFFCL